MLTGQQRRIFLISKERKFYAISDRHKIFRKINIYAISARHCEPHPSSIKQSILNWHDRLFNPESTGHRYSPGSRRCCFSSHSFWTSSSMDVPAGVTQEEDRTGFFIHLPFAVRALIFLARRIHPAIILFPRRP